MPDINPEEFVKSFQANAYDLMGWMGDSNGKFLKKTVDVGHCYYLDFQIKRGGKGKKYQMSVSLLKNPPGTVIAPGEDPPRIDNAAIFGYYTTDRFPDSVECRHIAYRGIQALIDQMSMAVYIEYSRPASERQHGKCIASIFAKSFLRTNKLLTNAANLERTQESVRSGRSAAESVVRKLLEKTA